MENYGLKFRSSWKFFCICLYLERKKKFEEIYNPLFVPMIIMDGNSHKFFMNPFGQPINFTLNM